MTQFITVTTLATGATERINVAMICRYFTSQNDSVAQLPGAPAPAASTTIFLAGGAELYVSETLAAVDALIGDASKTAIISAG
ncbi:MAG: hypothetical protein ABSC95_00560 [Acetobacteraceae bacterium]|jgi:hypothetical protein